MRLYHLRARYLDPDTGRFTQRDPLGPWGDPLALGNPTTYAANNPWTYTDPLGLCAGKDAPPSEGERYLPSMSLAEDKASPFWEGVKGFFSFGGDDAWLAVEGASIFPVFGIPADLALTSRDLYRGDYGMAAISASGMVLGPFAAGLRRVDSVAGVASGAARGAHVPNRAPDFVVSPGGTAIPVPSGATGPHRTRSSGFQYTGGAGGHGFDSRVSGVRLMDEVPGHHNRRAVYMNEGGHTVDRNTGRQIPPDHPLAHLPFE